MYHTRFLLPTRNSSTWYLFPRGFVQKEEDATISLHLPFFFVNIQIHFLHNQRMSTQMYSLVINKRERKSIGSTSKSATKNYLCPISATSLLSTGPPRSALPWFARHLRSLWHFCSPWQLWSARQLLLSIFTLLDNLSRPGSFTWPGNFIVLVNFAPLGLCSAFISSLYYSLQGIRYLSAPHSQFPALLRLHCVLFSACTTSCSLLAPSCVPRLCLACNVHPVLLVHASQSLGASNPSHQDW